MEWKEALRIQEPQWLGIGKHIAQITHFKLGIHGKDAFDLTNHLRRVGNQYIEPKYVEDYLSGSVSFGCFFPQFRDFLGILPRDVFTKATDEEAQKNLKSLDDYLINCSNPDYLKIFMLKKEGEELRNYVKDLLRTKRAEAINKPYHTIELGLDPEEDTNPYMEKRRQLRDFVRESVAGLEQKEMLLLPENTSAVQPLRQVYDGIVAKMQAMFNPASYAYYATSVIPGSRIVVQPASKRGRKGFTIDFLLPDGDYFDRLISECPADSPYLKSEFAGLDAWKEAYTHGTFTSFLGKNNLGMQPLSNLCMALEMGVDNFIPLREPTDSERYEFHQRWVISTGGYYHAGPNVKGFQEVERQMNNRPDPVGRSEFEDTAYKINSSLVLMCHLYDMLPELVLDKPLLVK